MIGLIGRKKTGERASEVKCPVCGEWVPIEHFHETACDRCHEECGAETRRAATRWNLSPEAGILPF